MTSLPPTVYLLVESHFQCRDYRRFGIEILQEQGIRVEVWEIFRPFRRHYAQSYRPPDPSEYPYIRRFERASDIYREIGRLGPTDVVIAPWGWANAWVAGGIFRGLASRDVYFGSVVMGTVAAFYRFRLPSVSGLLSAFYRRIPHRVRRTRSWSFLLLCGGTVLQSYADLAPDAEYIWTHALDYDQVLASRREGADQRSQHIVFLDEYVPFHPDYLMHGFAAPNSAAEYYPKLTQLFSQLEKQLGLPVVIAAHPRSDYAVHPDFFGGRRVVRGQTCALVRDAALVLTHCSVANNFTVAYRKPVLVLTTKGLRESFYGPYIESTAATLGRPLIDLDKPASETIAIPPVDEEKYRQYFRSIIKCEGTPQENTWRIFANYINSRAERRIIRRDSGDAVGEPPGQASQ